MTGQVVAVDVLESARASGTWVAVGPALEIVRHLPESSFESHADVKVAFEPFEIGIGKLSGDCIDPTQSVFDERAVTFGGT